MEHAGFRNINSALGQGKGLGCQCLFQLIKHILFSKAFNGLVQINPHLLLTQLSFTGLVSARAAE